jgi:MoxR-like ATPase
MLPSDVTGVSIFNQKTNEFEFRPGPVIAQIVLTDEINRATPKTQAALLEAMEERQVTVDGRTYKLPEPFMVMATQNPIEYEGTFPLPEAQMDRFLLRINLGYPAGRDEIQMLANQQLAHPIDSLEQVVGVEELLQAQTAIRRVNISAEVMAYIVELVDATRSHSEVYLGASPRGSLALYRTAQAFAAMQGRDYVLPDDVKALAVPALAHRLIVGSAARIREVDERDIVRELLDRIPVPGGEIG